MHGSIYMKSLEPWSQGHGKQTSDCSGLGTEWGQSPTANEMYGFAGRGDWEYNYKNSLVERYPVLDPSETLCT